MEIHQRISQLQKRLLDPGLGADRDQVRRSLEEAEADEAAWSDDLARALPMFRSLELRPARLPDVQRTLAADEAMLLFQTWTREPTPEAPYDDGSSWVLAVTRDSVLAHRIPDAERLQTTIDQWLALLERRDGSEHDGAVRLHRDLLAPALAGLPDGIHRLVVVPDGPLHGLPFDALRDGETDRLLAERYTVSLAPSAALWHHWRNRARVEHGGAVLAIADPDLPRGTGPAVAESWRQTGITLADLPRAREEAWIAAASGAPGSELRLGPAASEHFFKSTDLRRYDVLHLATHAVVDVEAPERSAVVLASGTEREDGLLQSREISALELDRAVVVLAACRSASGLGLRGEGVVGLARSFFEAGAHGVVGSLWPLRDDESSVLLEGFYRGLARGSSVAEAMAGARRERIGARAATAAWAGVVVLGDGEIRPLAAGPDPGRRRAVAILVLATSALLALVGGLRLRERRGSGSP
jgi:CHAT domain-containing protein